jgi:CubicO group peptidase (beta-lactamase class C family)
VLKKFVTALIALSAFVSCAAQNHADDTRSTRLDQIASSYTKDNAFMGTVLVVEGNKVLLNKGYGQADLEWNIPNAPDVKFRLGSITKQFTATLILLLQQDGKLNIADPVSKYLPDSPKAWEKITVANLLGHTSGIPNFTNYPEFMTWRMNPRTVDEELAFFRDRPLEFEPGSKFEYSNSNFEVLGAIVEKVSGKKYGDLLKERIFDPLGMHDSGLDADTLILPKRAQGYQHGPKGMERAVSESMTVPWAAGSIYSTTGDLLLWERGLFGGKILNAASLKQMTTPGKGSYGLGVFVRQEAGTTVVSHGGGIEGFNTDLNYVPDKNIAVIVLGNVNGAAPGEMGGNLVKVMLGQSVTLASERKEQPIAAGELAKFAGLYQLAPTFALTFTAEGDQLMMQATGQPKFQVFYEGIANGHPRFFLKAVDAEVEFIPDATGKIASLVLHQGGRDLPGTRQ